MGAKIHSMSLDEIREEVFKLIGRTSEFPVMMVPFMMWEFDENGISYERWNLFYSDSSVISAKLYTMSVVFSKRDENGNAVFSKKEADFVFSRLQEQKTLGKYIYIAEDDFELNINNIINETNERGLQSFS